MDIVNMYCDGACSGNPGPGAWAAIMVCRGSTREITGFEPHTTNNVMEVTACLEGLLALKRPCKVTIVSDSKYLICGGNGEWGVTTHPDLWRELRNAARIHEMAWVWVKGHAGHRENEQADRLAKATLTCGVRQKKAA